MAPRYAGVLFDFAGTVFMPIDPGRMMASALGRLGIELAPGEVRRLADAYAEAGIAGGPYPAHVPEQLATAYAERDVSAANHRRAYVGLGATVDGPPGLSETFYDELLRPGSWVPYSDALGVVDALEAGGVRVGMISNVGLDLRPILRGHGFAGMAERLTMSYELGVTKPSPEIFTAALETLGTVAAETLMVGDNASADDGGLALGMPTLLLPMTAPGTAHGLDAVLRLTGV